MNLFQIIFSITLGATIAVMGYQTTIQQFQAQLELTKEENIQLKHEIEILQMLIQALKERDKPQDK